VTSILRAVLGSLLGSGLASACVVEYSVIDETGTGTTAGDDDCPGATVRCGEACVDPASDPDHCGGCGQACAAGDVCDVGACTSECGEGRDVCARACVVLQSDPLHCGSCGETCDLDGACVAGDCIDACNDECDAGEICVGGSCECRAGLDRCNGDCVDLQTDAEHCGECGETCDEAPCGGGECQPAGCGTLTLCGSSCVDLATDAMHCGECDRDCDGHGTCVAGDCEDGG
jgi:hypothetical protein